jgi:hypothetical protein
MLRLQCDRQRAANRSEGAVQGQLAGHHGRVGAEGCHLIRRDQLGDGDGKIQTRALLANTRGGQVDHYPPVRCLEAGMLQRRSNAVDPFANGRAG